MKQADMGGQMSVDGFMQALDEMYRRVPTLAPKLAPLAVTCVQQNMSGPFQPNAPLTKALKNKGAKPLFDTGETRASITYLADATGFTVGSPLAHTPLINYGGTVTAKKAKSLVIPATRAIKRRSEAMGIRAYLEQLKEAGWNIVWRPNSVLGVAPEGATPQGVLLKAKAEDKTTVKTTGRRRKTRKKKAAKPKLYLLFYRKKSITVAAREFMVLHEKQQAQLITEGRRYMEKGL